jgi:ubiquinone/menaquinone biosynthesis C-methylase UbiE
VPDPDLLRLYSKHDFFTPGGAETIELIRQHIPLDGRSLVLDVAYGKGSGAIRIARATGARVLGVDVHAFALAVSRAASASGAGDRLAFVRGDGACLPVRDGAFDAAVCIGAPSIVGTGRCLTAMYGALRPGGMIGVSDWVWRETPVPGGAIPATFDTAVLTVGGYAAAVSAAGFEVVLAEHLPQSLWDGYYDLMREVVTEMRAEGDAGVTLPEEIRVYDRIGRDWWRYGVFIARRPA